MKTDPGSNFTIGEEVAAADYVAGAENGVGVDHADAPAVSFFLSVGDVTGGATVDMKLQHADAANFSDAVDDDGASGNDTAITQITASGTAQLNCPNPQGRYSRVIVTVAVANAEACVVSVLGPNRHIVPS